MRILIAALMAVSVSAGIVQSAGTQPAVAAQHPACAIQYTGGARATCYYPTQVAQAERQAPFGIRPSTAARQVMNLGLAQVIVTQTCDNCASNGWQTSGIEYLYGALPRGGDYGRVQAQPKSVLIMEGLGRSRNFPAKYVQHFRGMTMEISQAVMDHPYRWYGPWYLNANFPHRNLSLAIVANTDQGTLKRLAYTILRAG